MRTGVLLGVCWSLCGAPPAPLSAVGDACDLADCNDPWWISRCRGVCARAAAQRTLMDERGGDTGPAAAQPVKARSEPLTKPGAAYNADNFGVEAAAAYFAAVHQPQLQDKYLI
jgi:hypothetical protein